MVIGIKIVELKNFCLPVEEYYDYNARQNKNDITLFFIEPSPFSPRSYI